MKPSSSPRSSKPLIELDDLTWQIHRFERKKRRLHRKMMRIQHDVELVNLKLKSQQSARRDWMVFSMTCICVAYCIAWIMLQIWLDLRVLPS